MAGIPKVKIQFDADLDGLKKGTQDADQEIGGFAGKVEEFGKKAAAAFAVAAAAAVAYAGKLAIDGVKAAIEDEQAQLKLAKALETATGATDAQIKAVEDQILKTSLATGVADDKLRPALQRLAVATGDTEKAQKLLSLALDISAATGKPLEAVSNALGKAYEGNTTALAKLQVGISATEAKTLGYQGAVQQLTDLYGGAAAANADTYQGRIDRIKVAFDEAKETIGAALLPILDKLLKFVTDNILPVFTQFSDALNGKGESIVGSLTSVVNYVKDFFEPIVTAVKDAFITLGKTIQDKREDFKDILTTLKEVWAWIDKYLVPIFQTVLVTAVQSAVNNIKTAINVLTPVVEFVVNAAKNSINGFIDIINVAIKAYNLFARVTGKQQIDEISKIGEITSGTNLGNRPLGVTFRDEALKKGGGGSLGGAGGGGAGGGGGGVSGGDPSLKEIAATDWDKLLLDATGAVSDAIKQQSDSLKTLEALSFEAAQRARLGLPPLLGTVPQNFDLARVRRAEEVGNTYVTINGAIDPESTARQLINILNDSQARGTLGSGAFAV
jgi:hypothetical protein